MIRFMQVVRLFQINFVLMRHTFTRQVLGPRSGLLRTLTYLNPLSFFPRASTRGEAIRLALEELGPIFVKFGQLLSTRRDLIPDDIAIELSKLQDQVPAFPGKIARQIIETALNQPINTLFVNFSEIPLASASIAQVHTARLPDGSDIVIKIRRPKIEKVINQDLALLYFVARLTERFWSEGKRLHPVALVAEFEQTITDELDLMREAASAAQLRRNFTDSPMLYVPKIYWPHTRQNIMVMERIYGTPIADIKTLREKNTNLKKLAEHGVEIFFTQVFRDGFFHADMHPGNLFVDSNDPDNPKYLGVDFGIMGTLNPSDQYYLAKNLLAFFKRDYRRVALLHVESGWVPPETRVDQFESAIRTVCEPIFERPIKDISFAQLLLRLFQTAKRFKMEIQPQLMLLQKTLLSMEGLGRCLYPDLDLWDTAKPFMIKWMREQRGIKKILREGSQDWQETMLKIAKTPRVYFEVLEEMHFQQQLKKYARRDRDQDAAINSGKKSAQAPFFFGAGFALLLLWFFNLFFEHTLFVSTALWDWILPLISGLFILFGFIRRC